MLEIRSLSLVKGRTVKVERALSFPRECSGREVNSGLAVTVFCPHPGLRVRRSFLRIPGWSAESGASEISSGISRQPSENMRDGAKTQVTVV